MMGKGSEGAQVLETKKKGNLEELNLMGNYKKPRFLTGKEECSQRTENS